MTERENLVKLLRADIKNECDKHEKCVGCPYENDREACYNHLATATADYLLANGVIVQFFKVGGKVYFHQFDNDLKKVVVEGKIIKISKNASECIAVLKDERKLLFSADFLGETVFLTKEEAEAKLKELKYNA